MKNTKNIKSNTKRIIALALSFILITTLFTACGKPAVKENETTNSSTAIAGEDNSTTAIVPSIDDGEETTTAEAGETATNAAGKNDKDNQTATTAAGDKNTGKPSSAKPNSSGKPESKPVTTTKPASKPTTTRPVETTKPAQKPTPTTQPSTPSGNTYAYFRASTGEKIKYCTAYTDEILGRDVCTGISESNGKIVATYKKGADCEWFKCDNCGKYLCEGCQPVVPDKCTYCGKATCVRYGNDGTCYYCDQPVKGGVCHDCPKSPRR